MGLLFIHDHKFKLINNKLFSNGGLGDNILKRYTDIFGEITVGARIEKVSTMANYTEITNPKVTILNLFSDKEELEKQIKKATCVIIRLPSKLGLISMKYVKKYEKPYLIEMVGCPWDAYWNHSLLGKCLAPVMWYLTKRAVKSAPNVLYVTEKFLQKRYPTKGKTIACSDAEIKDLEPRTIEKRIEKIKNKTEAIILGSVGAVNLKYKGQEYVIKAVAKLKKEGYNIKYKIAGAGDDSYLMQVARDYEVEEFIEFCGAMPHDKVFDFLDETDIYIQPSLTEGLPRAVVEAMSRACPVMGSNVGEMPELIDKKYIFKKKNSDDICKKIKCMIDEKEMIFQAKRSFEKSKAFTADNIAKKRNDFYTIFKEDNK